MYNFGMFIYTFKWQFFAKFIFMIPPTALVNFINYNHKENSKKAVVAMHLQEDGMRIKIKRADNEVVTH